MADPFAKFEEIKKPKADPFAKFEQVAVEEPVLIEEQVEPELDLSSLIAGPSQSVSDLGIQSQLPPQAETPLTDETLDAVRLKQQQEQEAFNQKTGPLDAMFLGGLEPLLNLGETITGPLGLPVSDEVKGQRAELEEMFQKSEEEQPHFNLLGNVVSFGAVPGANIARGAKAIGTALSALPLIAKTAGASPRLFTILSSMVGSGATGALDFAAFQGLTKKDATFMDVLEGGKIGAQFGVGLGAIGGVIRNFVKARGIKAKKKVLADHKQTITEPLGGEAIGLDKIISQRGRIGTIVEGKGIESILRKAADKTSKTATKTLESLTSQKTALEGEGIALKVELDLLDNIISGRSGRLESLEGLVKQGSFPAARNKGQLTKQKVLLEGLFKQPLREITGIKHVQTTARDLHPEQLVQKAKEEIALIRGNISDVERLSEFKNLTPEKALLKRFELTKNLDEVNVALQGRKEFTDEGINFFVNQSKKDLDELVNLRKVTNEEASAILQSKEKMFEIAPELTSKTQRVLEREIRIQKGLRVKAPTTAEEFVSESANQIIGKDATASRAFNEVVDDLTGPLTPDDSLKAFNELKKASAEGKIRDFTDTISFQSDLALTQDKGNIGVMSKVIDKVSEAQATQITASGNFLDLVKTVARKNGVLTQESFLSVTNKAKKEAEILTKVLDIGGIPDKQLMTTTVKDLHKLYPEFQPKFIATAKELRPILKAMLERVNQVRATFGRDPIKGVQNYMHHFRNVSAWNRIIETSPELIASKTTGEGGKILVQDLILSPNKLTNILKKRMGNIRDKELNAFEIIARYTDSATKEIYIHPAIDLMKGAVNGLEAGGSKIAANHWATFIKKNMMGIGNEGLLRGFPRTRAAFGLIRQARARAALAFNIPFNLFRQTASLALTFGRATTGLNPGSGIKNTFNGFLDNMLNRSAPKDVLNALGLKGNIKSKDLIQRATSVRIKGGKGLTVGTQNVTDQLTSRIYRDRLDRVSDVADAITSSIEMQMQSGSVMAGYRAGAKMGYVGKELDIFANMVAQRSQSSYSKIQRPEFLNSEIVKALFPFQTFSVEMLNSIRNLTGRTGLSLPGRVRIGQGLSAMTGIFFFNRINELVSGKNLTTPGSAVPVIGKGIIDPSLASISRALDKRFGFEIEDEAFPTSITSFLGLQDTNSFFQRSQSSAAPLADIQRVSDTLTKWSNTGDPSDFAAFAGNYALSLGGVPGTVQFNRFIDTMTMLIKEDGDLVDSKGRFKFKFEEPLDILNSFVTGPRAAFKAFQKREGFKRQLSEFF